MGDWCLAQGAALASQLDLPVKIHTGYYAGHSTMPLEWIRPAHLSGLLAAHPKHALRLDAYGLPLYR